LERHQVPTRWGTAASVRAVPGRSGALAFRGAGQWHRHRAGVSAKDLRSLQAAARPLQVPRHRHRAGSGAEDRAAQWRQHLVYARSRRGHHLPLHLVASVMTYSNVGILLVEDDPGDVIIIREMLKHTDYATARFHTAA